MLGTMRFLILSLLVLTASSTAFAGQNCPVFEQNMSAVEQALDAHDQNSQYSSFSQPSPQVRMAMLERQHQAVRARESAARRQIEADFERHSQISRVSVPVE